LVGVEGVAGDFAEGEGGDKNKKEGGELCQDLMEQDPVEWVQ